MEETVEEVAIAGRFAIATGDGGGVGDGAVFVAGGVWWLPLMSRETFYRRRVGKKAGNRREEAGRSRERAVACERRRRVEARTDETSRLPLRRH
ncbi:hypothetical protein QYE76_020241 [Lolium multiflorum]|uniref:Uncharacterized protein n=1 Tax=Lolium multiflorum TaxID=4521 RepID=A0AAD8R7C0_LOLMU|nr:hypothetical protein QYE76_020241 [Lolium multiflorum]